MGLLRQMIRWISPRGTLCKAWWIIFLPLPLLQAQVKRFDHFSLPQGLSNSHITAIYQDSTGFLWVGTEDGLDRFDGYSFRVYRNNPNDPGSLPNNNIFCIAAGKGDDFWIGTSIGVARFNSWTERFEVVPVLDSAGYEMEVQIHNIERFSDRKIYAASNLGLFVLDSARGAFIPAHFGISRNEGLMHSNISWIFEDRDQRIWLGTFVDGVYYLEAGGSELQEVNFFRGGKSLMKNNKILQIFQDSYNTVWISTENGLFGYDKNIERIEPTMVFQVPKLKHSVVNCVYEDSRKNLWIGTDGALGKLDRDRLDISFLMHDDLDEESISHDAISCIYEDRQKNLWFGTKEEGLNLSRIYVLEISSLKKRKAEGFGLNYGYVLSVIEDRNGNLWIGTNGGGVNFFNPKKNTIRYYSPKDRIPGFANSDAIQCLFEDRKGIIWMGSYGGGLTAYDPGTGSFKTWMHNEADPGSLSSDIVNAVFEDSHNRLWVGTHGGLCLFDRHSGTFKTYKRNEHFSGPQLASNFISSIYEDRNGNIWIGTFRGLSRFNPATGDFYNFFHHNEKGSLSNNSIFSFYEDSQGGLWIGTGNGLDYFDPATGKFKAYYESDGLPNNNVNAVTGDDSGNLWVATNMGLVMFNPQQNKVVNFTTEDGLPSIEFPRGSCFKGKNGNLYFGTKKGLAWFNPGNLKTISFRYPMVITDLNIFNKTIIPSENGPLKVSILKAKSIELSHRQSFISIHFSALNFINQGKDVFQYRLHGLEENWMVAPAGTRMASYSNLRPGRYVFQVKVTNRITGTDMERDLEIIVHPPIWMSPVSFIFYAILLLVLAYFLYRFIRNRNVGKHQLLVERMEKEKAIEINQSKLRFFINVSHEFKTPLTLILSPLEKLISREKELNAEEQGRLHRLIYRNATRLSRLINQIMDLRKIDAGKMQLTVNETDAVEFVHEIAAYFEEQARSHSIEFTVNSESDHLSVWVDREKFEKIVFNLISNAFRYTPDGAQIRISLSIADRDESGAIEDALKVVVSDTGSGIPLEIQDRVFDRFFQANVEEHPNPSSTGVGLSIVREFVEMHHGKVNLRSVPGKGSVFTVYLPLGNKHFRPEEMASDPGEHFFTYSKVEEIVEGEGTGTKQVQPKEQSEVTVSRKKILIVEDNYELRDFLMDHLEERFDVYEAADGEEGLALVHEVLPEVVVSDVMMPRMNGIELCRTIKADVKISHIPVILITVLDAQTNQIEGLESGADDYLTKPFSIHVLELKIRNIIENRKKLAGKFTQEIEPDLKFIASNKTDERFILKANAIVEKNIANPDFSAEDFARELGMSRSNVHVKLRALVNQSSTEFIRTLRIKTAARLLSTTDLNVSEVSFKVGFNNISYFNRCFKKQFGMPPSDYLKSKKSGKQEG